MRVISLQRRPVTRLSVVSRQDDRLLRRHPDQRKRDSCRRPRPPDQLHHAGIGAAIHHDRLPRHDDRNESMAEQGEQALLARLVQPTCTPDHSEDWPLNAQPEPGHGRRHIRELTRPGHSSGVTVAEVKHRRIHRYAYRSRRTRYEQGRYFPAAPQSTCQGNRCPQERLPGSAKNAMTAPGSSARAPGNPLRVAGIGCLVDRPPINQ
jgi:hypothetical protein